MALNPTLLSQLEKIVGAQGVVATDEGRMVYEADMHTFYKGAPDVVVLPETTGQVAELVRFCRREHVALVPRGSGTGLIGGAMAPVGGVMVSLTRMNRILELDFASRCATVQPGLINLWLSQATREHGYYFAPDPSSQMVSSIGGNASTNAGGPHCLKYGITVNHVLGLEVVTGTGEVLTVGGKAHDHPGYDLTGALVGGEGTLGLLTAITVRLLHVPAGVKTLLASYSAIDDASETVSAIVAAGIIPAALEMIDETFVRAINEGVGAGYPKGAGAVLLIELDGPAAGLDTQSERVKAVCRTNGARELRVARDDAERATLWKCRKRAFGAIGRLAPNYCTQDGVVPRTRVPDILRAIAAAAERHRLRVANVFHAGDGNIHPILLFDERDRDEVARVLAAGREILEACVALGGSITGEHGIGVEKIGQVPLLFGPDDLRAMARLRAVFDPEGRANPHKIFPDAKVCVETRAPRRQAAL